MVARLLIGSAAALLASSVMAAEPVRTAPASSSVLQPSFVSEVRIGASAHDPSGPESGSANFTGEILFAKPFRAASPVWDLFIPRPHVGGSVNFAGKTSFAYAGVSWTFDITPSLFAEASFGGAVHNGDTHPYATPGHNALGCSPIFRESGSIGYRLDSRWSVMATVEHLSNAGLCSQNRGLTNVGVRLGYTF
jgi:hypothetical protein